MRYLKYSESKPKMIASITKVNMTIVSGRLATGSRTILPPIDDIFRSGGRSRYSIRPEQWPTCTMGELFVDCMDRLHLDSSAEVPWAYQRDVRAYRMYRNLSMTPPQSTHSVAKGFSFKEYMAYALYDPQFGYYTTQASVGVDFKTNPIEFSPFYGKLLSEVIFRLWKKMLQQGMISQEEPIDIVEMGAGNGVLACDMIEHLQEEAHLRGEESDFARFYRQCRYTIYEISPKLRDVQCKKTEHLRSKIQILTGDARKAPDRPPIKGFIISNELPDAFPMHKIRKSRRTNDIEVSFVFPKISNYYLFNSSLTDDFQNWIEKNNLTIRKSLPNSFKELSFLYLSKKDYQRLRRLAPDIYEFDDAVEWESVWVNYRLVGEVYQFCLRHHEFVDGLKPGQVIPLNTDLAHFQKATSQMMESGYKITIDYQDNAKDILNANVHFRCYPDGGAHDFSTPPGTQDITADVSGTALAVEGLIHGWRPIFFGSESSFLPMVPEDIAASLSERDLNFNVLIEKKGGNAGKSDLSAISRSITYRELLLDSMDRMRSIPNLSKEVHPDNILLIAVAIIRAEQYVRMAIRRELWFNHCSRNVIGFLDSPSKDIITAIRVIVLQIFTEDNLYAIAAQYEDLSAFDFNKISHYFSGDHNDETKHLIFLLVRQLLQLYYHNKGNTIDGVDGRPR